MIYFTVALQGKEMLKRLLLIFEILTSTTKMWCGVWRPYNLEICTGVYVAPVSYYHLRDSCNIVPWNLGIYLPDHTVSHPRSQLSICVV